MDKINALFLKYKEIIMYLIFGVLTTVVSLVSYFIFLNAGITIGFCDENGEATDMLRVVANILSWVLAVLFAFYTNRKWVFEAAKDSGKNTLQQLAEFSGARVLTLLMDTAVTIGTVKLLEALNFQPFWFIGEGLKLLLVEKDHIAKLVTQVLVVIGNYVLSKLWVFKAKKQ